MTGVPDATIAEALGDWADKGYYLKEYADDVVTVCFKDKELAAFHQTKATPEKLQDICSRHHVRITQEEALFHD